MHPDEREALTKAYSPWNRSLIALVIISILLVIFTMTIGQRVQPGIHEHFLGQSTKQTATVTHIEKVNICGRTNKDEYTMTWTEGGTQRTETVRRCGDPWEISDQVEIWSTSGIPQTTPRIVLQLTVAFVVVAMATVFTLVLRIRRSVIDQAQTILNGTWHPIALPTVGLPGTGGFLINPQAPLKTRMFYRTPTIYRSERTEQIPQNVPGTLYTTSVRKKKARGVSLHVSAAGSRQWSWQGK